MQNRHQKSRRDRIRRHARIRHTIHGSAQRPRLSVFRSLKHLMLQLIDDDAGRTLVSAHDGELSAAEQKTKPIEQGRTLGKLIAKRALEKQISQVVFDRGGRAYHGRVRAVAEGAREAGLQL